MIKKYKGEIITFYICAIISLIFASFYDLKIDIALNNPTDPLSLWFYGTGEMPVRLALPLAGAVIFGYGKHKISKPLGLIVCAIGSCWLGIHIADYLFVEENYIAFGLVYGIGCGLIMLTLTKYIKLPENVQNALVILAYAGIIAVICQIAVTEGTKFIWGRVRFRVLLAEGSYDRFTPWYHLNGFNFKEGNDVKSCPSGHTAGAAISYLMMLLPMTNTKYKNKQKLCFIVPFIYTSVVAYTRLVMGAHYLSDVTIGAIFTFTIVIITISVLDKKYKNTLAK